MNKKLITTLLATFLLTGFAVAQEQTATAPAATTTAPAVTTPTSSATTDGSCCATEKKNTCHMEKPCTKDVACDKWTIKKSCHDVLTKDERHRFCCAKAAAIAANPALAEKGKGHKKALCEAICKQDPSMKPIMEKLKKHCEEMRKQMKKGATATAS
jgi:hypothetical protein